MTTQVVVPEEGAGSRLDVFVAASTGRSRARSSELIDGGWVLVNGARERKSYRVSAGDLIAVGEPETEPVVPPEDIEIAFEDDDLLVVSKPAGVVVHPAPGVREGTLVDALKHSGRRLAARGGADRPGIVHRLDRDVSGLLVVAKTDEAHEALSASLAARDVERVYLALVNGSPASDRGKIDAPVGRHPRNRTKMAVVAGGRPAVTWFAVSERFGDVSLLEVRLETGRTHQIRTHLASIGHPIAGDAVYGRRGDQLGLGRPFLHAWRLRFVHPSSGRAVSFESDLPPDLAELLDRLRA